MVIRADDSKPDCPACTALDRARPLLPAASHPQLRGSPYARRRDDGRFVVCQVCERVWSEHFDSRERYTYYRFLGDDALPLLAADSTLVRIVEWVAVALSPDGRMVESLARRVARGARDWQAAVTAILRLLAEGPERPTAIAAERIAALFRIARIVLERTLAKDLRPAGVPRPTHGRVPEEALVQARAQARPHEVDGLAYLGWNPDSVRRIARERAARTGAASAEGALIAIEDLAPVWHALDRPPLGGVPWSPQRGYLLRDCWQTLDVLRREGRAPGNEHVVYLPPDQWQELERRLDPVRRLAGLARTLLDAAPLGPEARFAAIEEAVLLEPELSAGGARLHPDVVRQLQRLEESMRDPGAEPLDHNGAVRLDALLRGAERARGFDWP